MVLMKTTWSDFWENSGDAPFSSIHNVMDIVKQYKNLCPINAIGIYISDQKNKNISLLEITKISHSPGEKYDIKIKFKFVKKIEIRSYGFERGIGSTPLLAKISDKSTHKVFSRS